jgi:pimeloyl-ACP methyl ester carboxylesterase
MATIILVHGINQQQQSASILESQWLPALAKGVLAAGFPEIASGIWRTPGGPGNVSVRMAFYGNLFVRPGAMGTSPPDGLSSELAEELALEWLRRCAMRVSNENNRLMAETELAYLHPGPDGEAMGVRSSMRVAWKSLARFPWFAQLGMGVAQRFVSQSIAQVTDYLSDDSIRAAAQRSVLDLVGPDTRIILGHSLGSVVAFEVAHLLEQSLPLLVTMGSPLGLDTIIYPRIRPQPPSFPRSVSRWVNVADRDDVIAAEPNLATRFAGNMPRDAVFEGGFTVENGADPHNAEFYLSNSHVSRPVGQVMSAADDGMMPGLGASDEPDGADHTK